MKKIAIILSGSGFKDGSEITEAVSSIIALSEANAQVEFFAPNIQHKTVNHLTGTTGAERSVLEESARISRGQIHDLLQLKTEKFDGLVLPGGYGAAKNLCDFATSGAKAKAHPEVKRVITEFHADSKPICAMCIAPALVALVLGQHNITVTIGNDKETASEIEKTGAQHEVCRVDDYVTDRENKIITTPAYMYEAKPHEVFKGVRAAIREFIEMA